MCRVNVTEVTWPRHYNCLSSRTRAPTSVWIGIADSCGWKKPPKPLSGDGGGKPKVDRWKTSKPLRDWWRNTERGWSIKNLQTFAGLVEENWKRLIDKKPPNPYGLVEENWKTLAHAPSPEGYNEREPIDRDHALVGKNLLTWWEFQEEKSKVGRIENFSWDVASSTRPFLVVSCSGSDRWETSWILHLFGCSGL